MACGLAAAWLAGALLTWLAMYSTDWRGDEYTYVRGARLLADVLAGRVDESAPLPDDVGAGWFMPGMYALGAPVFLIDSTPPPWIVRGWIGLINTGLSIVLFYALSSVVGRVWAMALIIFPGLVPLWHIAAFSFLPDLTAGILLAVALTLGVRIGQRILLGSPPGWRLVLGLEAVLVAALFLRGPMLLPALAIHAVTLTIAVAVHQAATMKRLAAGLALFAAVLGCWSAIASRHFGEFVLTTTNVPLVLADSFGDPANNCLGPCPRSDDDIWPTWHHSQAVAAQTGENPLAVQRRIRDHALASLTPRDYLRQVREHFSTFLFDPAGSLRNFVPVSYGIPPRYREPFYRWLAGLSLLTYVPFMLALFATNLMVFRRTDPHRLESIMLKLATACLFLQPFVHKSSARYWVALAPLAAWAVTLIIRAWRIRRALPVASSLPVWLDWAQSIYVVAFAGIALLLVVA